ncbi:MAG: hypothetical protein ABSA49_14285, partial [Rhizomicrobium sp.]
MATKELSSLVPNAEYDLALTLLPENIQPTNSTQESFISASLGAEMPAPHHSEKFVEHGAAISVQTQPNADGTLPASAGLQFDGFLPTGISENPILSHEFSNDFRAISQSAEAPQHNSFLSTLLPSQNSLLSSASEISSYLSTRSASQLAAIDSINQLASGAPSLGTESSPAEFGLPGISRETYGAPTPTAFSADGLASALIGRL